MEARIPELEKKIDGLRRRLGEEKREKEQRREQEEDKVLVVVVVICFLIAKIDITIG